LLQGGEHVLRFEDQAGEEDMLFHSHRLRPIRKLGPDRHLDAIAATDKRLMVGKADTVENRARKVPLDGVVDPTKRQSSTIHERGTLSIDFRRLHTDST